MERAARFELACLTTVVWKTTGQPITQSPLKIVEPRTGIEPVTFRLQGERSTTELPGPITIYAILIWRSRTNLNRYF